MLLGGIIPVYYNININAYAWKRLSFYAHRFPGEDIL